MPMRRYTQVLTPVNTALWGKVARHIFRWGYPGIALHSTASVLIETERRGHHGEGPVKKVAEMGPQLLWWGTPGALEARGDKGLPSILLR